MQNGKLHKSQRNVVILSIKPKRPTYPEHQKLVPVKEVLKEWDRLDAYYRGQLLQCNVKTPKKSKKKNKEKSSIRKHDHVDLFGDENVFHGDIDKLSIYSDDDLDFYENNYSVESKEKRLCDDNQENQIWDNHLATSKEDFTIRLDAHNKKRSSYTGSGKSKKMLSPIVMGNYSPPVAAGFNSVHIQKILYHKFAPTESPSESGQPESSCSSEKNKPVMNKPSGPKLKDPVVSNTNKVETVPQAPIKNNKNLLSKPLHVNTSTKDNDKHFDMKIKSCDNNKEGPKKKTDLVDGQNANRKRKIDPESPVPVSSTSELFEKISTTKKDKRSSADDSDHSSGIFENGKNRFSPNTIESVNLAQSKKHTKSLVNSIVNQSRKTLKSSNEKSNDIRQKQRHLESKKRKTYTLMKGEEHEQLECIELAFKSFELILDCQPLSPIRSPPTSRWS